MTDKLIIAGTKLNSRLILGTAGYPNQQVLLDGVAGRHDRGLPFGTTHDRTVQRDGEEPGRGVDPALGEELGDRRDRDLLLDAVDPEPRHHASAAATAGRATGRAATAKRSGENGRALSGSRDVNI